ncbi:hypothetical protein KY328_01565 [Candidatus Woesearchaeota archaeon]|nr:hypothetical protein [Candidatus Woesearchaeota archaeon]MBW3021585.1 hypothetical protein [Candidatus Woesearchaeota archaeon]
MKIEISIKKKHLYILSILLIVCFGILASGAIDRTKGWLSLDRIATDSTGSLSIDENGNGKIDTGVLEGNVIVDSDVYWERCHTMTPPTGTSVATHKINFVAGCWAQWTFEQSHTNFLGGEITSDSGTQFCCSMEGAGGYHGSYMIIAVPK